MPPLSHKTFTTDDLIRLKPRHDSFVGIDSDGCVFDSMEAKQKLCFHGLICDIWNLRKIESYVRESAEFVNLRSRWRGRNRFPNLVLAIDLLRDRPEVVASGVALPDFTRTRQWIESCRELGNPALEKLVAETHDPELADLLRWSKAVNAEVARHCSRFDPFPAALEGLKRIAQSSDAICVSQTPTEALMREWTEAGLLSYVELIAGQELGTKSDHLQLAATGKYPPPRILMIGDALGDLKAARETGAHFFPVNPGSENRSWERFCREGYDRFLNGAYAGAYENALIDEFKSLLPEVPPWTR
jgi:phosphoglycolate phosphatase-like HAD superfamily hydrolase